MSTASRNQRRTTTGIAMAFWTIWTLTSAHQNPYLDSLSHRHSRHWEKHFQCPMSISNLSEMRCILKRLPSDSISPLNFSSARVTNNESKED